MLTRNNLFHLKLFLSAFLILLNCQNNRQVYAPPQMQGEGIALLKITASANSPFKMLARGAVLVISAPDMLTMTKDLTVTDSSVQGAITGIPAGKHRLFQVTVYDSNETIQYKGSAYSDVIADSTVQVTLSVIRIGGNAIINGNVIENGTYIPEPGIVAYWAFDSIASGNIYLDYTNHGYDIQSTGTVIGLSSGVKGKALDLPGGNYELVVKNSKDSFNLKRFTIESWFYSNIPASQMGIGAKILDFQFVNGGIYNGYSTHIDDYGNVVFSMSSSAGDAWETAVSTTSIQSNTWYHLAFTYDGSFMKVYVNGVLEASTAYQGTYVPPQADARVACQRLTDGTVRYFVDGKLDELKLYNYALPGDSISAYYAMLKPN